MLLLYGIIHLYVLNKRIVYYEKKGAEPCVKDLDLKKMNRSDLLEILIEQSKKIDELNAAVEQLQRELYQAQRQLQSREIEKDKAGSIAQAALQLNGVFEAAQAACDQYVENVKRHIEEQIDSYNRQNFRR